MNLIIFYIFATLLVIAAATVVIARNAVHATLFLIFAFFCAAGIFLLQGAEFLALLLVIIYVGAVAILFLFVVMMLDIDIKEYKAEFKKSLPVGIFFSVILFFEVYIFMSALATSEPILLESNYPLRHDGSNIKAIGEVLYTDFFIHFQLAGLILLLAMVGAVMLTLQKREGVKKQNIAEQVARTRAESVKLVKVLSGKGV